MIYFDDLKEIKNNIKRRSIKESWNKLINYFDHNTLSILGDSISTFEGLIDKGCKSIYPLGDVQQVSDHYIGQLKGILLRNSSYKGSGLIKFSGKRNAFSRVDSVIESNPSVILVLIGINDCDEFTTTSQFKEAYSRLVDKLLAGNSTFYLCTLLNCSSSSAYQKNLPEYNKIIRSFGNVIDLNRLWTQDEVSKYTIDGLHPNKRGMKLIAKEINKVL